KVIEMENIVERQSERLASIRQELNNVDDIIKQINDAIGDADIPALETAIGNLNTAVSNLTDAVDAIPEYENATTTTDGLMSKEDKTKLNRIIVSSSTNLDNLRNKLGLFTVTQNINLDQLKQDVEDLKNA